MTTIRTSDKTYIAKYSIGDIVYYAIGPIGVQVQGLITAIHFRGNDIFYSVTWADTREERCHCEMELITGDESQSND